MKQAWNISLMCISKYVSFPLHTYQHSFPWSMHTPDSAVELPVSVYVVQFLEIYTVGHLSL